MLTQPRRRGDGLRWLFRVVDEAPDGRCRDWPYGTWKDGYGQVIFVDGRPTSAHRAALILATDANPRDLQALHSCDRPICCAPWHLRWGTPQENKADAVGRRRHATAHLRAPRMCRECGMVSNPGAIGRHQKYTNHQGVI